MKKRYKPEDNRATREAVTLALILAKQWGQELFVCTHRGKSPKYVVWDKPYTNTQDSDYFNCWRVSPGGDVVAYPGFPEYHELYGRNDSRLRIEAKMDKTDEWFVLSSEAFLLHERPAAEGRAKALAKENINFQYRIKEG